MTFDLGNYVDVPTRIRQLREKHPEAVLRPANPAEPFRIMTIGNREFIIYTAACYRTPDDPMPAIAVAAEPVIGQSAFTRNSEVMNAETSAWGRCIMAALAVDEPHIASRNEVQNRREDERAAAVNVEQIVRDVFPESSETTHPVHQRQPSSAPQSQGERAPQQAQRLAAVASQKQVNLIKKLARERQITEMSEYASGVIGRSIDTLNAMTTKEASKVIESLMNHDAS
jgi:hypothetical protein